MRKRLTGDLLDDKIIQLVGYDENEEPKIYFLSAPKNTAGTYIEYEIYDTVPACYEEGEEKALTHYIQVSIYSNKEYEELEKAIRKVLKSKGYCGGYGPDLEEKETKLYHKPLRFNYTEMLEEE